MKEAIQILERELHETGWAITKPKDGVATRDTYVATHGDRRVFLKFDVNAPVLRRLAALHVAPTVRGSGISNNRSYVIQDYIEGSYPDRAWFRRHVSDLAPFIQRYHADEELRILLAPPN